MGARYTDPPEIENVYAAAQKWVDRALRRDDSLFTLAKLVVVLMPKNCRLR